MSSPGTKLAGKPSRRKHKFRTIPAAVVLLLLMLVISTARPVLALSNGQSAALVIGQTNFTSSASAITASGFYNSHGIAFDSSGDLWVVEIGNDRVLEFTPPFSTGESASLVIGQQDFMSAVGTVTASNLEAPDGLAFDSHGNLWVSDTGNNRVLEYTAAATTVTTTSSTTMSSATTSSTTTSTTASLTTTVTTAPETSSITTSTSTTSSTPLSTSSSGIPEFPYQVAAVGILTALLVSSYLLVRRQAAGRHPVRYA